MGYVLSHWVTCYHIWVFSRRCSVLKAYLGRRTACLGTSAHRPCFDLSVCLQPVCLSPDSQSDCLRFFSPPHPPLVDSLDSKLWYHFGCRAAALASAAPRPLGSLSAAFHHAERAPRVTSSLTAESPTIRSFKTSLVSIQRFSPPRSCTLGRLVNKVLYMPVRCTPMRCMSMRCTPTRCMPMRRMLTPIHAYKVHACG